VTETQVVKSETRIRTADSEQATTQPSQAPATDATYLPDVDICENGDRVLLLADMPGVDSTTVNVTVENNVLTIEGQAQVEHPQGYELVGQEYEVGKYRRAFALSDAVSADGIKARLQNGVLEVTIPMRAAAKRRRIKIETQG